MNDSTALKEKAESISNQINNENIISFFENEFDYLHPLLLSYDHQIAKLKSIIENYSDDLN